MSPTGLNPNSLRGSRTGVYVGVSGSEAGEAFSRDPEELLGYSMTGCQRAMLANRLSYFFDFKGTLSIQNQCNWEYWDQPLSKRSEPVFPSPQAPV